MFPETAKTAKTATAEAPPEMPEKLGVGAAIKELNDKRYAGLTMTGPKGSSIKDTGMGLDWGKIAFGPCGIQL